MSALPHVAPTGDRWEGNLPEINTDGDAPLGALQPLLVHGALGVLPQPRLGSCLFHGSRGAGGVRLEETPRRGPQPGLRLLLHCCATVGSVLLSQGLRHYVGCVTVGSLLSLQGLRHYVAYCYKASGTTQAAVVTAVTAGFRLPRGPCVIVGSLLLL